MRYKLYILLFVFGLNQTKAQVFLSKEPQHVIGLAFISDIGKPFDFRYTYLKKSGPSYQFKASRGLKNISVKYGPYQNLLFGGGLLRTKRLNFWLFEPGIMIPITKKNFKQCYFAVNFPIGISKVKTLDQFMGDPIYGNTIKTYVDPRTYFNYSLEFELIWSFNLIRKSIIDLGFSVGIPIKSHEVFPEENQEYYYYVPGAGIFPFVNMSFSYNFCLGK
jgi:hypothetical protein